MIQSKLCRKITKIDSDTEGQEDPASDVFNYSYTTVRREIAQTVSDTRANRRIVALVITGSGPSCFDKKTAATICTDLYYFHLEIGIKRKI